MGLPRSCNGKESAAKAEDTRGVGLIPRSGRSPAVGNGNQLQDSCLENSMDRGAWWTTVHGVAKSWTWLSNWAQYIDTIYIFMFLQYVSQYVLLWNNLTILKVSKYFYFARFSLLANIQAYRPLWYVCVCACVYYQTSHLLHFTNKYSTNQCKKFLEKHK